MDVLSWLIQLIGKLFNILANAIMYILNAILRFIISILDVVLPSIGLSDAFMSSLDAAITSLISIFEGVGYFLPLTVFNLCLTVILAVEGGILIFRIGKWILQIVRG